MGCCLHERHPRKSTGTTRSASGLIAQLARRYSLHRRTLSQISFADVWCCRGVDISMWSAASTDPWLSARASARKNVDSALQQNAICLETIQASLPTNSTVNFAASCTLPMPTASSYLVVQEAGRLACNARPRPCRC